MPNNSGSYDPRSGGENKDGSPRTRPRPRTPGGGLVVDVLPPFAQRKRKKKKKKESFKHGLRRIMRRIHTISPLPAKPRYRFIAELCRDTIVGTGHLAIGTTEDYSPPSDYVRYASFTTDKREMVERTWDESHAGPPYHSGGPFRNVKADNPWYEVKGQVDIRSLGFVRYRYKGGFVPSAFGTGELTSTNMANVGKTGPFDASYVSAEPYGTPAWNRFKPHLNMANAAVFFGELKDLPGMLRTSAEGFADLYKAGGYKTARGLMTPQTVSNHFLNHVYGWVPFVNDLVSFHRTHREFEARVNWLKNHNGQWKKRKGTYLETSEVTNYVDHSITDDMPLVWPPLVSYLYDYRNPARPNMCGRTVTFDRITDKVWFEASMRYWIPMWDSAYEKMISSSTGHSYNGYTEMKGVIEHVMLYGARVSPVTIYKLFPWSWLLDWYATVGDVLSNLESQLYDNLLSRYAYVMRHRTYASVNESTIWLKNQGVGFDNFCRWTQFIETKDRAKANPFGFGLTMGDLSYRQMLILGALGLNR